MITTFLGLSIRIWVYAGDPDNNVRTAGGSFADIGEWFMNTNNGALFVCTHDGSGTQTWQTTTNTALVQALINAIPQADWNENNPLASDYIKNKPAIPAAQIQSDWNETNSSLLDYIKNKPSIPAAQIQSDWNESNIALLDYIKNKPSIPAAQIQSDWNQTNTSLLDYIKNKPSIPSAQIQSDWTQTNTSSLDYIKNKPAARSQSSATRSFNTAFQISTTRDSLVTYSADISTSATLIGGQTGTIYLEICATSGFSSGVQELARFANGNSVSLAIAITVNQLVTGNIGGYVPSGFYCRLRTENTVGTPSFTYRSGQEVLL